MKRSTEKEVCPQEIPAHFPVKAPEYYNFGYDVVDEWARRDRNKLAMIWANQRGEEKRFTFHDMSKLSNQAANLLIKLGITAGDRVFIMLPRLPEWWIFSLALIKLGAVQCPSPTADQPGYPAPHPLRQVQDGHHRFGERSQVRRNLR